MNIESYVCQFCGKYITWNIDTDEYVGDCKCQDHADGGKLV